MAISPIRPGSKSLSKLLLSMVLLMVFLMVFLMAIPAHSSVNYSCKKFKLAAVIALLRYKNQFERRFTEDFVRRLPISR